MVSSCSSQDDAVDLILRQWATECPGIDTAAMGTIGRLKRCAALVQRRLEETFAEHGLSAGEFDVLATLRRSGKPYRLAPTPLFSSLMVTSGTMTHRLQKLEQSGWVARTPNPDDARSLLVELTPLGLAKIDNALGFHLANEERILASLGADARARLDEAMRDLLAVLEVSQSTAEGSEGSMPPAAPERTDATGA